MFDLTAFDAEIARGHRSDRPGDDVLLARSLRPMARETGITRAGGTTTALVAALLLASMTGPGMFGAQGSGSTAVVAHPTLAQTMHIGWLTGDARTWPHDPNRDRS